MIKKSLTQTIREASVKIFDFLTQRKDRSVRQLADQVDCSKSSVHRQIQAIERRNQHPESACWETKVGEDWLRLLVFSSLFCFGIRSGVGADALSDFFKLIRIDSHVGVSPSVLRTQLQQMELLLPQFQQLCEQNAPKQSKQITAALDETFFGQFMILVLIDLNSGYLLLEDIADDRRYETWLEKTTPRLEQLGVTVTHAISDRAKALIKMAITGFECESGADLFHAQQDMSRFLGGALSRRVNSAQKTVEQAQNAEMKTTESTTESQLEALTNARIVAEQTLNEARQASHEYHENLHGVADELHPFSLNDNGINDAGQIQVSLEVRAQAFEKIANEQNISDHKGAMKKFRNQFAGLITSVTFWWAWVFKTLQSLGVSREQEEWLTTAFLPVIYWHQRMEQTKNPKSREKYRQAWERATENMKSHPLTSKLSLSEIEQWQAVAENMVRQFHRSSSAVEGRNGCLSQMYHNGRGFTEKRLHALTVVHNYFIRRLDGTTAAMRLFGVEHPDLFTWLLNQMGALPLPRKSRGHAIANPLRLLNVPS